MCHVHGCNKEVQEDDNSYYTCAGDHKSEEVPAIVYRVNIVMKSAEGTDTTRHKVQLLLTSYSHTYSVVELEPKHVHKQHI